MGWLHPSAEGSQKGQGAGNEGHSGFRISSRCISVFKLVHPYQCGPADHHPWLSGVDTVRTVGQWGQCDQYYHVKKKTVMWSWWLGRILTQCPAGTNNITTAWRRAIRQLQICPEGFQMVVGKRVIGPWQREGLRGTDWSRRFLRQSTGHRGGREWGSHIWHEWVWIQTEVMNDDGWRAGVWSTQATLFKTNSQIKVISSSRRTFYLPATGFFFFQGW